MILNEVRWNVTHSLIYLQSSEAVEGNCNLLVYLMSITFVSVLFKGAGSEIVSIVIASQRQFVDGETGNQSQTCKPCKLRRTSWRSQRRLPEGEPVDGTTRYQLLPLYEHSAEQLTNQLKVRTAMSTKQGEAQITTHTRKSDFILGPGRHYSAKSLHYIFTLHVFSRRFYP